MFRNEAYGKLADPERHEQSCCYCFRRDPRRLCASAL